MLTLLAFFELLRLHLQRIVHWMHTPHRLYYRSKAISPTSKHNHNHTPQKPEWLKVEIIRLKALMPQAGCRSIADICNRRFAASRKVTVGKTYVHQILQRNQYEIQILRRNLKHAKPKNIPRNLIWGIDLTGKTDTQGCLYFLFGILDHGSRALLHLQALHNKTSRTLIACISEVIRIHGKPKIIRTDNEAIFTSHIFRHGLKMLGIRHQRTNPGCPWQNGRIERLFGTLKQKLDQRIYFPLPQGLNRTLLVCPLFQELKIAFHVCPLSRLRERVRERGFQRERVGERASQGEGWREITSDLPACGLSRMAITNDLAVVVGQPSQMASSFTSSSIRAGVRNQLNRDLDTFRYWYNHIRPHQNLNGKTPAEAWSGSDPYTKSPKQERWFEAWDGLLAGYELKH